MATIIVDNKKVEIAGVNIEQLRAGQSNKGNTGVMGFIRTAVKAAGAVFIVDLERDLIKTFPGLPEAQARVRINHFVTNNASTVTKAWAVYTQEPKEKGQKNYKGQTLRIVCTTAWLEQARKEKQGE